ncbi:MAG: Tol-Pal system beta propeller repeat protein TolB [Deltaproteobacteria bacterium]|nr:Tol-Pal system beta propeller repeat protein TolB [Deltaproteobacteria bacterium]
MKKVFLISSFAFFFCALPVFSGSAAARIYVDIDSPTFQLISIAICDFNNKTAGAKTPAESGIAVSDYVRKDLSLTGIFNILNNKSFLEDKDSNPAVPENIRFADWAAIGADYLLRGKMTQNDKGFMVECRLYDVTRGEILFDKKYNAEINKLKTVSRAIASDILLALINDEGDFGTRIAFVSKKGLKSDIYSINYDGSELKNITNHQSIIMTPRWSPDGNFLAFTSFKGGRPEIYIRNLKNGTERKVASFDGLNLCGSFSPDSKKLLLTLSKEGNEEIYVLETDTLNLKRLTNNYSIDVSPAWSPDGKKIAFVSNRAGSPQIYTMDADGNNVKRITYEGNYNTSPSWSPRGNRIAYEGLTNDRYQIFSIDAEGNNSTQLTSDASNNESPSWSPSGRQIVYVSRKSSNSKINIINSNGSNPRVLNENSYKMIMPAWSPRFK